LEVGKSLLSALGLQYCSRPVL